MTVSAPRPWEDLAESELRPLKHGPSGRPVEFAVAPGFRLPDTDWKNLGSLRDDELVLRFASRTPSVFA